MEDGRSLDRVGASSLCDDDEDEDDDDDDDDDWASFKRLSVHTTFFGSACKRKISQSNVVPNN